MKLESAATEYPAIRCPNPVILITQIKQDLALGDIVEINKGLLSARYLVTRAMPAKEANSWCLSLSMLKESGSEEMYKHLPPHLEMIITPYVTYVIESVKVCIFGPLASPLKTDLLDMCVGFDW